MAVSGQNGVTNQFAGFNVDQLREQMQSGAADSSLTGTPAAPGGRSALGGRAGVVVEREMVAWHRFSVTSNQTNRTDHSSGQAATGALNAADFPIRGQEIVEPNYGQNLFGLTYVGAPYIPKLLQNDTKDFLFFGLSTQRASQPFDQYGTVPTADEREGNLSSLTTQNGSPITIYDPAASPAPCTANGNAPGQPFSGNIIPSACISQQAHSIVELCSACPTFPASS